MKKSAVISIGALIFAARLSLASINIVEDFSTDPVASNRWHSGLGNSIGSRFVWNNDAPSYTGDASGSLMVSVDSSLPTIRLDLPLGVTLTDTDAFTVVSRFSLHVTSAPNDGFAQFAFGLVNSALTLGDRTGSASNFTSDNVFNSVEFNYFPNNTSFGGRVLSPAVFGAQKAIDADAFENFAPSGPYDSRLGDNLPPLITELEQDVVLQATLDYSGATRELTLTMHRVASDGSLTLLQTGLPVLDLDSAAHSYDASHPFVVDSLAIMAYHDGWIFGDTSLVGTMTFQRMQVTSPVPEPSTLSFLAAALLALAGIRRLSQLR